MKVLWPDNPIVILWPATRQPGRDSLGGGGGSLAGAGTRPPSEASHSSGLDSVGVVDEELEHVLDVLQHDHVVPEDEPVAEIPLRVVGQGSQVRRHHLPLHVRVRLDAALVHRHLYLTQHLPQRYRR